MSSSNDAEQTIEAIHHGTVDALVVQGPEGPQIVMLQSDDEPYRVLVERMSDGALTLGPGDRILYVNQRLAELTGEPAEGLIGRNFSTLFCRGETTGEDGSIGDHQIRRRDERVPVSIWTSPMVIGGLAAKLVIITDLSVEHRVAEVLTAERFARSILEQATDAVLVLAPGGRITHASLIAERLAQSPPVGRLFSDAYPLEFQADIGPGRSSRFSRQSLNKLLATRPFHGVEVKIDHSSHSRRSFLLSAGPLVDEQRVPIGAIVTLTEITERKQAEEKQLMLVAELNHRVKNILAVVQAVASQTVRASDSLSSFKSTFSGRVKALSIAHDFLTRTRWIGIGLSELIDGVLAPYQSSAGARVVLDGPPVLLPARTVVPLSMALHELATNASKYGSLSTSKGTVSVNWMTDKDDSIEIEWREEGGPPIAVARRVGFGTTLIQRVVQHDLEGTADIDQRPAGLVAMMRFPIGNTSGLNDLAGSAAS